MEDTPADEEKTEQKTEEKVVVGKRFGNVLRYVRANRPLVLLSLTILVANLVFYYYPVLHFGYAPEFIDAEDHSFSVKLLAADPLFFFRSIFSFDKLCSPYHSGCRTFR